MLEIWIRYILAHFGFYVSTVPASDTSPTTQPFTWTANSRGHLPVVTGADIAASPQFSMIMHALRESFGETEEVFENRLLPLITSTLDFLQLLPGSKANHHDFVGGAAFHALDVTRLLLERSKDVTEFIPPGTPIPDHRSKEHRIQVRLSLALLALCHDVPKISNNLEIKLISPHDPSDEYDYLVSADKRQFNVPLSDFARAKFPGYDGDIRYRLIFKRSPKNIEYSDISNAMSGVLQRSDISIDSEVVRRYFPERNAQHHIWYRKSIYPALSDCDAQSSRWSQANSPVGVGESLPAGPVTAVLTYLAESGFFDQCDDREYCLFLPIAELKKAFESLPENESFAGALAKPGTVEGYLEFVKKLQSEHELPFMPKNNGRFHLHKGQPGLYLTRWLTRQLLASQREAERWPANLTVSTDSPADSEASLSGDFDIDVSPAPNADTMQSPAYSQQTIDVSDHGLSVEPPPSAVSQKAPDPKLADKAGRSSDTEKTSSDKASRSTAIVPDFPDSAESPDFSSATQEEIDMVTAIGTRFESITPDDIGDDPDGIRLIDDSIVIGLDTTHQIVDELQALGVSRKALFHVSSRYCRHLWQLDGDFLQQIALSPLYSTAILDQDPSNPLLIGYMSLNENSPVKPPRVTSSAETSISEETLPKIAHQPSTPDKSTSKSTSGSSSFSPSKSKPKLTAHGFLRFVKRYSAKHSDSVIADGDRLSVSLSVIDAYVQKPVRRGELINVLERARLLVDREPRTWYLDLTNDEVSQCLNG